MPIGTDVSCKLPVDQEAEFFLGLPSQLPSPLHTHSLEHLRSFSHEQRDVAKFLHCFRAFINFTLNSPVLLLSTCALTTNVLIESVLIFTGMAIIEYYRRGG